MVRELTDKYTRVREHLRTKDIMVRELTDNYTRVREHLRTKDGASVPVMERELKELMSNYTRVREQLSFYEAQSSNCEMTSTAWGGKLYYFSSDKLNWLSSRAFCISKGADLVTITSQSEQVAIISLIGSHQSKCLFQFHPVEDRIHHVGMDGLLRNCATGCRVDEAFTMDDLVDSISADTSGLRCGHVQLRIVFITPTTSRREDGDLRSQVQFLQDEVAVLQRCLRDSLDLQKSVIDCMSPEDGTVPVVSRPESCPLAASTPYVRGQALMGDSRKVFLPSDNQERIMRDSRIVQMYAQEVRPVSTLNRLWRCKVQIVKVTCRVQWLRTRVPQLGPELDTPLDLISQPDSLGVDDPGVTSLDALKHSLQEASDHVRSFLEASHSKKKRHYNKRRHLVSFSVNDLVQVKTHPRSDASTNFAAKLAPLYAGPYWVTKKLSNVNYKLTDVTTGKDAGVFHVVSMEPFRTWDSGNVSEVVPVEPPPEVPEDSTLLGDGRSGHETPGVSSCEFPINDVGDLLESDVRVSLSDLFDDVSGEGVSECVAPAISCDLTEGDVDCVNQRYNLRPRLVPRITSGWATNRWTNVPFTQTCWT
ncbi:C-type lectin domain family 4 member F [Anabarilius grahami]|uniref:C-type lectin domain family 4 member F n=1 Tax=Anabarilius grahami TaxID=495550 RepID=A0A3N0XE65_ANAGA|nr:C-type lectin domain family 4 member F [Anabarilius grahami]